ncbi:MAG TPA: hypothetical protein VLH40_01890 [Atribacteraceae bacterium]|nr:hypothetical protein [Atribacteraceae bacterium]
MVVLYDEMEDGFLVYLGLERVLRTGEDLFMMVAVLQESFEAFKSELDQILASFTLGN